MSARILAQRASVVSLLLALPVAAVAGSGAGCAKAGSATDGTPSTSNGSGSSSGGSSGMQPPQPCVVGTQLISDPSVCKTGSTPSVGGSPLRRISRVEYNNMVRDLLNDQTHPADQFVSESPLASGVNFNANTYTYVTDPLIPGQYLTAAETLASKAVSDPNTLQNFLSGVPSNPCGGMQYTDTCAQAFIDWFANRAFRGNYDPDEGAALFNIYQTTKAQFDFQTGIQAVITTVLTSPRFLFVLEFGNGNTAGNALQLSQYEVAARLALFLWRSIPDATLLQAAANNQLSTPDQIQAQALRMLTVKNGDGKTLKAADALDDFVTQWMELENTDAVTKDTQFTAVWNAQLADDLKQETLHTFHNEVLMENNGAGATLGDVLSSGQSYINTNVAKFYGVSGGDDSYQTKTSVNPPSLTTPVRAGILTNGSVMATQAHTTLTSPTLRGKLVREQVLCDPVPLPPAQVGGQPIPPPASSLNGISTRDNDVMLHLTHNTICANCHQYMNYIGFAFGNLDTTGAYQATDSNGGNAGPYPSIDPSGTIFHMYPGETDITFSGPVDLANKLASDPQVSQCYTLQEFRYALGRIESPSDACAAQQVYQQFQAGNFNLQSVIVALVRSDSFRYRSLNTPNQACAGNCQ